MIIENPVVRTTALSNEVKISIKSPLISPSMDNNCRLHQEVIE
jgi:hypothetical protein